MPGPDKSIVMMTESPKRRVALFLRLIGEVVKKALAATIVIVVGGLLVVGIQEYWPSIKCWIDDESGSLSRTCALHKVTESSGYEGAEVVEITGIADMSDNVKRVEFTWRLKPNDPNPDPQETKGTMTFRKYDDGWRAIE